MARSEKGGSRIAHGSRLNEKHLTGKPKRFFSSDYKHFPASIQCQLCGSDYMRFAVDGHCQRCQQRAEHRIRERGRIYTNEGVSA